MSEQPAQEPTMEEILASIRRIISEDETPAAEAAAAEPEPEAGPEPAPEPVAMAAPPAATPEEEVLELTEKVETHGDIDAIAAPPPIAAPAPPPAPAPAPVQAFAPAPEPVANAETLVSAATATAAASVFGQLATSIHMPPEGLTLADTVRDLLRPLLKEWLDNNLTEIVQATVAAEVERIARSR